MVEFINDEWIPLAVSLQVPCDKFYSITPKMLMRQLPYYLETIKQDKRKWDEQAWLHNSYTRSAIVSALTSKAKYPQRPIDFYGVMPKEEFEDELERPKDVEKFLEWAQAFNAKREKESEVTTNGKR